MLPEKQGFTLIEVIISLTIMSVLVTIIYFAFSIALSTWKIQERATDRFRRMEKVDRLLQDDWSKMRPYTFSNQYGKFHFNLGRTHYFFYVTGNALGSRARSAALQPGANPVDIRQPADGLFFALLMLVPDDEGSSWRLLLYKTPWPEQDFLDLFVGLYKSGQTGQTGWQADSSWQGQSLVLLTGLKEPRFVYLARDPGAFSDARKVPAQNELSFWVQDSLPGAVRLEYRIGRDKWQIMGRPVYRRIELDKDSSAGAGSR